MTMTLEQIRSKLSYILQYHKPEKIKLSAEAKKYDILENARKRTEILLEKTKSL